MKHLEPEKSITGSGRKQVLSVRTSWFRFKYAKYTSYAVSFTLESTMWDVKRRKGKANGKTSTLT